MPPIIRLLRWRMVDRDIGELLVYIDRTEHLERLSE